MLIEEIISTVVWLILSIVVLVGGLGLLSVQRRVTRRRYFQSLDEARQRVKEVLDPIYENPGDPKTAAASLRVLRTSAERRALEEHLLRRGRIREQFPLTRDLILGLGWIFYVLADMVNSGSGPSSGGRRAFLKQLVAWVLDLVGTTGVVVVFGLLFLAPLIWFFMRVVTPPVEQTLTRVDGPTPVPARRKAAPARTKRARTAD